MPVNSTINGAATWTVYQFSRNKKLCYVVPSFAMK